MQICHCTLPHIEHILDDYEYIVVEVEGDMI